MKSTKIMYWTLTAIIAIMMIMSAYAYFTNDHVKDTFTHLGFPDYFRIELAVAKIAGALVLLLPVSRMVKEWAYAGFAINFVSGFIAHAASGDPFTEWVGSLVFLTLLAASYFFYHKVFVEKRNMSAASLA